MLQTCNYKLYRDEGPIKVEVHFEFEAGEPMSLYSPGDPGGVVIEKVLYRGNPIELTEEEFMEASNEIYKKELDARMDPREPDYD